ncbi:MAG: hypothetical protein GXO89_06710, partial [Chlorobi bacterium]|nr:hypothetical protein [Chlorobiota bacterium]
MNNLKLNLALLVFVFATTTSFAMKDEFVKEISKTFDVDNNATLVVK